MLKGLLGVVCPGSGGGVTAGGGAIGALAVRGRWAFSACSVEELIEVDLGRFPSRESVRIKFGCMVVTVVWGLVWMEGLVWYAGKIWVAGVAGGWISVARDGIIFIPAGSGIPFVFLLALPCFRNEGAT